MSQLKSQLEVAEAITPIEPKPTVAFRDHRDTDHSQYHRDFDQAMREKSSVVEVQKQRHIKEVTPIISPKQAADLDRQRSRVQSELEKLEAEEQRLAGLVQHWECLLRKFENAQRELRHGADKFAYLNDAAINLPQNLSSWWGQEIYVDARLLGGWINLVAAQLAVKSYPEWKAAKEKEIADLRTSINEFAQANNIPQRL